MKVVILCGGFGTRMGPETDVRPKPMVKIGRHPILWHIMQSYAHHGFADFVLCLGYKGEQIKEYFLDFEFLENDFTVNLASGETKVYPNPKDPEWRVTLADTGLHAKTGARVKRIEPYVEDAQFMLTYGDGVTNLDINALLEFHRSHGSIGTVTGVTPASQYGELTLEGDRVLSFQEKPASRQAFISGGYFVFDREFFDYLDDDDECVLEREPLERLAADGQLMVHTHDGFWQCMDTPRDLNYLRGKWRSDDAPWRVWLD